MSGARHWEQDKEATVYIGNLDERVTDSLVWELMLQAGRIVNVHLPKDRVTQTHQGYGFVEFVSEEDAEYASRIMNQIRLYGKPIRVNKASADKLKTVDIGAELFIGNLDPMVTEQILYETFSRFGPLISLPKISRDENNLSRGFGFVSYAAFEASDDAIANMNGQFLMNREISVQYAYKKDGRGERHGDQAERMLAAQARKHNMQPQPAAMPPPPVMGATPPMAPGVPPMPVAPPVGFAPPHATPSPVMPPDFAGRGMPPVPMAAGYPGMPPMPPHRPGMPPPPPFSPAAPTVGLPARPPPPQGPYGAPPPGFAAPPRFPPPPPAGFGTPAPGAPGAPGVPGSVPPPPPPGFQQPPYGRGR